MNPQFVQQFVLSPADDFSGKQIPSIYDLPLPNSVNTLFKNNEKDTILGIGLQNSNQIHTSSDSESQSPSYVASPSQPHERTHHDFDRTKGIWNPEEDDALRKAIAMVKGNISWEDISKKVPGRNPKQCRERWLYRLCPGVNKTPFQKWEDELIVLERQKIGNHWTAIASKLPGRTSYAVKNRWYTVLRNRVSQSSLKNAHQSPKYAPVQQYVQPAQIYVSPISYNVVTPYLYQPAQTYLINYI